MPITVEHGFTGPFDFDEYTKLCNLFDQLGHVVYRLSEKERLLAFEQWSEIGIRYWIRLKDFVRKKRPNSIERDYAYFEWLASKCYEFHHKYFPDLTVNSYKPRKEDKDNPFEIDEKDLLTKYEKEFENPSVVEEKYIRMDKQVT